jgi:hypothetical protein
MLVHAAAESAHGTARGTRAVVLGAPNESSLRALSQSLSRESIPHAAFCESELPYAGQLMSVGIEPVQDRRIVRRFLKGFSLVT